MRIHKVVIAAAALGLCFLLGCSKGPAALELSGDACISPLQWGMTQDEASKALSGYELTVKTGEGTASISFDAKLFGQDVSVIADLGMFSEDSDWYTPPEQAEPVLMKLSVLARDAAALEESISAVLGEQQTSQVVYYDNGGETGVKEGGELEEEQRYWRSPQVMRDIFSDAELELFDAERKFKTATDELRFYDTRAYVVSWGFMEDDKVALTFNGRILALRHVLGK